ncbi:pilin [Patescibacteria group bacterium]|jgi:ABC-type Fe3+ transport system permease subunit|nr:pilin [Patescibacteria group bacterium]
MNIRSSAKKIFLATMLLLIFVGSGSAMASTHSPGSPCTYSTTSFYGFPTWYEYLPAKYQSTPNGKGSVCLPSLQNIADIWLIVAAVIDIILRVAGLAAVMMVIYGGVKYTTSMGNPEATASAKNTIIYALIGLLLAISASLLVTFVAKTFGASG